MTTRRTALSHNIIAFCRFLRANGLAVGPDEETTVLLALAQIDLSDRDGFRLALRTVLCRRAGDMELFDRLFAQYWKELDKAVDGKRKDDLNQRQQQKPKTGPNFNQLKSWLYGNKPTKETELATYSVGESLSQKDFSLVAADDLAEVMQRIRELSLAMARRANRRHRKTTRAQQFDLRRTLRKNLRRGGELVDIAYRKPRPNHRNVVVLADVSQSMELYSTFLIQFLYAFQTVYRRIDTFVFSTHLQRVTALLKNRPFAEALGQLAGETTVWGGGTRIGASLHEFTDSYLSLVDRHTLVIILSDGWDTGDVTLLTDSLAHIKAKARKLLWVNPLAGNASFQPTVSGMEAALPFLDGFAPVHNVESLKALQRWL